MNDKTTTLALVLILAVHIAAGIFWIVKDKRPPFVEDSAKHALDGLRVLPDTGDWTLGMVESQERHLDAYPPVHRALLGAAYMLMGATLNVAQLLSLLVFLGVLFATYLIAQTVLAGNRSAALIATIIAGCFPAVLVSSRASNLSMSLALAVCLTVLSLIKCDGFRNIRWSVLLGVFLGLGMLVKWSFLVFVVAPIAFTAVKALRQREILRRIVNAAAVSYTHLTLPTN